MLKICTCTVRKQVMYATEISSHLYDNIKELFKNCQFWAFRGNLLFYITALFYGQFYDLSMENISQQKH